MMKRLHQILLAISALFAALFFLERFRRKSAEGLLENTETKEKVIELEKEINKNEGLLKAEEVKREEIKKTLEEDKKDPVSQEELEKFLNGKT